MTERSEGEARVSRGELVAVGPPESLQDWAELLVTRARQDGVALTGEGGLLTGLMRHVLQTGLEVEMAEHLGYGPHERAGRGRATSRDSPSVSRDHVLRYAVILLRQSLG